MVKVVAENFVKAECVEEYLAVTKELVEKTNALDKGCIQYELCRDVGDPLRFLMLETWEDQASLDNHMKAAHFLELIPKLGPMSAKQGGITILSKVH